MAFAYIGAIGLGLVWSIFSVSRAARWLLRLSLTLFGLAYVVTALIESHCGGGFLKGLSPCPSGPWLNQLALAIDDWLILLTIGSLFAIPAVFLLALLLETLARRDEAL